MAQSDLVAWQNPLTGILPALLGGSSDTDINKSENTTKTGTNTTTGTQNQQTTGTNNQQTTGSFTQKTDADIGALQQVYAKQAAGITPEMLSAIFEQGARQVPGLTTAYANAVGARNSANTPLATSLRDLQGNLTNQAAVLNNQLLKDSGITAAQIAELTKAVTGTNASNVLGTTGSNTIGNTQQTTNINELTDTDTTQSVDTKNTVNTDVLKVLAGLGLGGSALDNILTGAGVQGGLGGAFNGITTGLGNTLGGALGKLFSGGAPNLQGMWGGLFGEQSLDNAIAGLDWSWAPNYTDLNSNLFDSTDLLNNVDWSSGVGDFLNFGWADGGTVSQGDADAQMKQRQQMLQQLMSDPRGQVLMYAKANSDRKRYEKMSADDWRKDTKKFAKANNLELPEHNFLDAALGLGADDPTRFQKSLDNSNAITDRYLKSLPIGAARQYMKVMNKDISGNKFNQFMDRVMPMIPMAVAGLGAGGALGLLGSGTASAAGFGAAGAGSGFGSMGNFMLRQLLSTGLNAGKAGMAKLADGGTPRRPGDPVVGTKGPERTGSGGGGLSKEAVDAAIKKVNDKSAPEPRKFGYGGVSMPTAKALKELDNYAEGGAVEGTPLDHMMDPEGTNDTVDAKLSVNEYVIPADVVDTLGQDFFDHLLEKYHTPVAMQEAMGVGFNPRQ